MAQLTHDEVKQLKEAGFDSAHIADVQVAKAGALQGGQDWLALLSKLIENGPQILAFLKLFSGLFGSNVPPTTPPTIPPK